jgi:hypothetical protein
MKSSTPNTPAPRALRSNDLDLDIEIQFHDQWSDTPNMLLIGADDSLHLGYSDPKSPHEFGRVTLKEALEWFTECDQYATGYNGSPSRLCGLAAAALPA